MCRTYHTEYEKAHADLPIQQTALENSRADIAEVMETLNYLQGQREAMRLEMKDGQFTTTLSREEILADLDCVIVQPDGKLQYKLKGIESIDKLVAKHRYLIEKPWTRRRLA